MTDRGCFGLPSVFNRGSDTCNACPARTECRDRALRALQIVRKSLPVEQLIQEIQQDYAGVQAGPLSLEQVQLVASVPVKLQKRVESLLKAGFHLVAAQAFARGENPFPETGAKHMHLAGAWLLRGGFDRTQLRDDLIARYGWGRATAYSEVSNAIAILTALGLVQPGANVQLKH